MNGSLGRPWGRVQSGCCAGSWAILQLRNHPIDQPHGELARARGLNDDPSKSLLQHGPSLIMLAVDGACRGIP